MTRAKPGNPNQADLSASDQNAVFSAAMTYCKNVRRAFLLIDPPPEVRDVPTAVDWKTAGLTVHDTNGAAYFPRLKLPDATNDLQLRNFAPCGVLAGLYARTDASRGVWKAPAGVEATLSGVQGMTYKLTDPENGAPQSARSELPAHFSDLRRDRLGRPHPRRRRRRSERVEIHSGPPLRSFPRGNALPRDPVGRLRA